MTVIIMIVDYAEKNKEIVQKCVSTFYDIYINYRKRTITTAKGSGRETKEGTAISPGHCPGYG